MQKVAEATLSKRFEQNPLLRPAEIRPSSTGMAVECLLNPGVFQFENKTWLLLRVAERPKQTDGQISVAFYNQQGKIEIISFDKNDPNLDFTDPRVINYKGRDYLTTLSHLRLVCSEDGKSFYEPDGYDPIFGKDELESYGIEDCRVTSINGTFNLTYTMVSHHGVGVGLIQTKNWKDFNRRGMILPPHNKDCALFNEKINGKYYALHRPSSPQLGGNYIWFAESTDLLHWGNHKCIASTRNMKWDSARVGAGAAPIKTDKGWLEIYHGADSDNRYCLGLLLLDLNDPFKVLARSDQPIMEPTADYERTGFFGNVVFTNGHIVSGDTITIYYGASDEVICAAKFSISELLTSLNHMNIIL
jgi:predicted GH43/DUF377 family glycosyl hydrolase